LLVVSHDREFLDGLVNVVYEFRDKKIKQHLGGIYEFIQRRKIDSLRELEKNTTPTKGNEPVKNESVVTEELSFEEKKEINRQISRAEKQIETVENKIASLEEKLEQKNQQLYSSENNDHTLFSEYEKLKLELDQTMVEWEKNNEELDLWKNKKTW